MLRTLQRLKTLLEWLYRRAKMTKAKKQSKEDVGSIWEFLAGLAMGFIGYTILSGFVKPKSECPNCGRKIDSGIPECPYCNTLLGWK